MGSAIIAGIINTSTGEILETTTNPSAKTALRLKVRDELNAREGDIVFMTFEFDIMGGSGNIAYVRSKMQSTDPGAFKVLELLRARYNVDKTEKGLVRAKAALDLVEKVSAECLALYDTSNAEKRDVVESAFSTEIDECQAEVDDLSWQLREHIRRAERMEANYDSRKAEQATDTAALPVEFTDRVSFLLTGKTKQA